MLHAPCVGRKYHTITYNQTILCYTMLPYHTIPRHTTPYNTIQYYQNIPYYHTLAFHIILPHHTLPRPLCWQARLNWWLLEWLLGSSHNHHAPQPSSSFPWSFFPLHILDLENPYIQSVGFLGCSTTIRHLFQVFPIFSCIRTSPICTFMHLAQRRNAQLLVMKLIPWSVTTYFSFSFRFCTLPSRWISGPIF